MGFQWGKPKKPKEVRNIPTTSTSPKPCGLLLGSVCAHVSAASTCLSGQGAAKAQLVSLRTAKCTQAWQGGADRCDKCGRFHQSPCEGLTLVFCMVQGFINVVSQLVQSKASELLLSEQTRCLQSYSVVETGWFKQVISGIFYLFISVMFCYRSVSPLLKSHYSHSHLPQFFFSFIA